MIINDIYGIEIENFRLFHNQIFNLGKRITVVSGRNGTMKSTLMGLIAQPYRTDQKDIYDNFMQTKFSDVFKLSSDKDTDDYVYHIKLNIDDNILLKEPIPLYFQPGNPESKFSQKDRHRLVPSGRAKGDGYFSLPSMYINLKRLYPLIDSGEIKSSPVEYTEEEKKFISSLYQQVLLRTEFSKFTKYSAKNEGIHKNPYGPDESYYDINSISSGEDNLSAFCDVLLSFMRVYEKNKRNGINKLTGILSIDEFEASLHPIAQVNLFNFLYKWAIKYNVKIILNTHSLFLIQNIYLDHENDLKYKDILINFIASQFEKDNELAILENPTYSVAYNELTLSNLNEDSDLLKVKILCEDDVASLLLKRIISSKKILNQLSISHTVKPDNPGVSYKLLATLCRSFPSILLETGAIVVFDADMDSEIMNTGNYKYVLSIPSLFNGLPFEKEIVKYILNLNGDNRFFKNFKKTKEMFKQTFVSYEIPLETDNYKEESVKNFKRWYLDNKNEINKYLTYYVKDNQDLFIPFKKKLLNYINEIRKNNGFTELK
ncbi:conserved hypothetical protein [Enterococcus faecium Com12]|nr:conserved hypothetical protein [Enterococcus faecium Com12]RIX93283.1 hypothetical protein D3Y30_10595 [Enterococcus faecium TX1330]